MFRNKLFGLSYIGFAGVKQYMKLLVSVDSYQLLLLHFFSRQDREKQLSSIASATLLSKGASADHPEGPSAIGSSSSSSSSGNHLQSNSHKAALKKLIHKSLVYTGYGQQEKAMFSSSITSLEQGEQRPLTCLDEILRATAFAEEFASEAWQQKRCSK